MFACADALNLSRVEMIGTLVSLWLWALDNAQDGSLSGVSDRTIARVCDWPEKKAKILMDALFKNGFLDKSGDHYIIHDWYDYAGKLMERRDKDRKRKRTSSNKNADFRDNSDGVPAEQIQISCATVPNRTLPYPTVPIFTGAAGDIAGAREASEEELASIGLKPGEFCGVTSGLVEWVLRVAEALLVKYRHCKPEPWDCKKIFLYCEHCRNTDLLEYAFETAALAGKADDWRYIDGIMGRFAVRGIQTPEQAREWDSDRPDREEGEPCLTKRQ